MQYEHAAMSLIIFYISWFQRFNKQRLLLLRVPNGRVFVYELSGSGFESSCSHLYENLFPKKVLNIFLHVLS